MVWAIWDNAIQRVYEMGDYIGRPEKHMTGYLITQWARPFIYHCFAKKVDDSPQFSNETLIYYVQGEPFSVENIRRPSAGQSQKIAETPYELYNTGVEGAPCYKIIELSHSGIQSLKQLDRLERRGVIVKTFLTVLYAIFFVFVLLNIYRRPSRALR